MAAKTLETRVRYDDQRQVAIVDLDGEINAVSEAALRGAYDEANRRNPSAIVLNLHSVDYINSAGLALIIDLLAQARRAGRRLLACGLSDHYVEIFKITRLVDFMSVHPDEASALSAAEADQEAVSHA
jgi:anti-sigma B factor antagonist